MNMNQIMNMFVRLIMRKAMNKGINAGIKGATGLAQGRKRPQPQGEIDDYGNPVAPPRDTSERDRIRAERRARRAMRDK